MDFHIAKENYDNPNDTPVLLKDLIEGEEKVSERDDFKKLSSNDIQKGLELILSNKNLSSKLKEELLINSWKINYREKPPSMKEFLTEKWIGPMANSIFVHNREILEDFWSFDSTKRHLILGTAIGTGKSTTSTLHNLYVTVIMFLMRNPKKFFGLAPSTSIVQAFISFSQDKANQLLLQPFIQILSVSPKFYRVKIEENLKKHQDARPDKICWTSASKMGALQFPNDIHYIVASGPHNLLGLNIIQSTMSEISFFIDRGFSTDYIWRIYVDSKERIKSRFGNKYLCGTVLDSSPNDLDSSPIDKYIFTGEAFKDPENYVSIGSQWDMYEKDPTRKRIKELYPKYAETGETFPVFRGSASSPAEVLNPNNIDMYPKDEILNVPIDLKREYVESTTRAVKNTGGYPSGSSDKLISEQSLIENIFTPQLKNIQTYIMAPSTKPSAQLLWNEVRDKFFIKIGERYEFYRAPKARRVLSFDLSETGDMMGISMSHWELDIRRGEKIIVHDFTLAVSPAKGRINLDAVRTFPEDLRDKGCIDFAKITFDNYQSHSTISYLKEKNFNVGHLSSDLEINVYLTYVALINIGVVKAGRNIFLKNNLKSIHEVKTQSGKKKIDHVIGKVVNLIDTNDWNMSRMGTSAKDISDTTAENAYVLVHEVHEVPRYIYNSELDVEFDSDFMNETVYNDISKEVGYEEALIKETELSLGKLGLSIK
ncbi:MAG: hypothetical protein ACRCZB_05225 [Bacteroidales bacterium]